MDQPVKEGYPHKEYPQGGYPPPEVFLQGAYHPPGAVPYGGHPIPGALPHEGHHPQGAFPQGRYPPPGPITQEGHPPQGAFPQGRNPPPGPVTQEGHPPQGAFPQGRYPPPGPVTQEGHSPQGAFPQGRNPPPGPVTQEGHTPQGAFPQGRYPPPGPVTQEGHPPQGAFPQGRNPPPGPVDQEGHPPQGAFPQGRYPPPGPVTQGGHPPQWAFPQGAHLPPNTVSQGGYPIQANIPQGYSLQAGVYPTAPAFQPGDAGNAPTVPASGYGPGGNLGEDGEVKGFDFSEKSIRKAFIRKVYAVLLSQLLVTLSIISLFTFHEPTKQWVMMKSEMLLIAIGVTVACVIPMACCECVRRKSPMNFIFLGIFTLAMSFMLGVLSSVADTVAVMMAVGFTAAICLALTLFAMQTKFDFTVLGAGFFCALFLLLLFGFIAIFIPKNNLMTMVYASVGALLFSLYFIYDTQLMMGEGHKYTISPEEYVFAALNLYLDIIYLFIYILGVFAYYAIRRCTIRLLFG